MLSLFSFGREQDCRNNLTELGSSANGTASVVPSFGYLPESRNVSTVLLHPPRTSLFLSFVLYRALVAGRQSAMAAARSYRGRGSSNEVERPRVVPMESRS
jgi:hypothetical protein